MKAEEIVVEILKLKVVGKNLLVGIDGRSGSGKTSLAKEVAKLIRNSEVVHLDEFDLYQGLSVYKLVLDKLIKPIQKGSESKVFILEGVFALNKMLRDYYDYKIWVECSRKIGFERGLKRDLALNGVDNSKKWKFYWLPQEDLYIEKEKPYKNVDLVVDGTNF